jgi:hypothetical protein
MPAAGIHRTRIRKAAHLVAQIAGFVTTAALSAGSGLLVNRGSGAPRFLGGRLNRVALNNGSQEPQRHSNQTDNPDRTIRASVSWCLCEKAQCDSLSAQEDEGKQARWPSARYRGDCPSAFAWLWLQSLRPPVFIPGEGLHSEYYGSQEIGRSADRTVSIRFPSFRGSSLSPFGSQLWLYSQGSHQ